MKAKLKTGMLKVQSKCCSTCIYRKDSPLDIESLERQVRNDRGDFEGYRICHHSDDACCRGFWERHGDHFTAGQVARRLNLVRYVDDDRFAREVPEGD